jgi:hypothetical protein
MALPLAAPYPLKGALKCIIIVPSTQYPVPSTQYPVPSTQHHSFAKACASAEAMATRGRSAKPEPSTEHRVPRTKYLEPSTCYLASTAPHILLTGFSTITFNPASFAILSDASKSAEVTWPLGSAKRISAPGLSIL